MRGVGIDGSLSRSAATAVPFGGTRRSGVGRELGRSGRDRFASIKSYGILSPLSPDAGLSGEGRPMALFSAGGPGSGGFGARVVAFGAGGGRG